MAGLGASGLHEPLALLRGVKPDVVIYGCTSATLSHGPAFDRAFAHRIASDCGAKTVTAAGALVHTLQVFGVTRIGFASPYVPSLNDMAIAYLAEMGIVTVHRSEVAEALGNDGQGALTPDAVFAQGLKARPPRRAGACLVPHRHAHR